MEFPFELKNVTCDLESLKVKPDFLDQLLGEPNLAQEVLKRKKNCEKRNRLSDVGN